MGVLNPRFVVRLEDRMQAIVENEYLRLRQNSWWRLITKVRPSTSAKDIVTWLLSTAMIRDQGKGGNIAFSDLVSAYTEIENKWAGDGFKIRRDLLEDTNSSGVPGADGMQAAAKWAADIGSYMQYWPQKQVAYLLKNGHTASLFTGYDGKALFATDHPVNPYNTGLGSFQNIFTGAASGNYPGACPIDIGVDDDDALANLMKIYAYIASILMPNGEDPRGLRPKYLLCNPQMYPRVAQLTSAKFIAKVAGSGAGSADVSALIQLMGYAPPVQCDELSGYESNTTFFVACEQEASSELGAVIYNDREPFRINYYGILTDSELGRKDELEWHCKGRNTVAPGHPYLIFKCKGT